MKVRKPFELIIGGTVHGSNPESLYVEVIVKYPTVVLEVKTDRGIEYAILRLKTKLIQEIREAEFRFEPASGE